MVVLGAQVVNITNEVLKNRLIEIFGVYPNYILIPHVYMNIDPAGAVALLADVFGYSRNHTKYATISVIQKVELPGMPFIDAQHVIYGSQGYTHKTIVEVIDYILNEKIDIVSMVTHKFKREDLAKALKFAASCQGIKVIIDYKLLELYDKYVPS